MRIYDVFALKELLPFKCPESARPLPEASRKAADISIAGRQLVQLRYEAKQRSPRIYTGRLGGKRAWRGMSVVLPSGQVGTLIAALRGVAVVSWTDAFSVTPNRIGYFKVGDLTRFRAPAAIVLGRLKRGVKEQRSERKRRTSRVNGHAPPRPGSRPRGRPRNRHVGEPANLEPT